MISGYVFFLLCFQVIALFFFVVVVVVVLMGFLKPAGDGASDGVCGAINICDDHREGSLRALFLLRRHSAFR